jgi:RNA polymerase sigma-70 factor (ECF subfamily)
MKSSNYYWELYLSGNNEALGFLYQELFQSLVFVSIYQVKNNEIARDIVSDLFVSLLAIPIDERKEKWASIEVIKAYLSVAVKNRSIDYLRTHKNQLKIISHLPLADFESNELFINEILELLSPEDTRLFQLHLNGYKNEEIGQKLTLSEKTVRNKLSLTRKKLAVLFRLN